MRLLKKHFRELEVFSNYNEDFVKTRRHFQRNGGFGLVMWGFQLFLKTFSEILRLFQGLRGFCLCHLYKTYCRRHFLVPVRSWIYLKWILDAYFFGKPIDWFFSPLKSSDLIKELKTWTDSTPVHLKNS
jgi:hypothetical protein